MLRLCLLPVSTRTPHNSRACVLNTFMASTSALQQREFHLALDFKHGLKLQHVDHRRTFPGSNSCARHSRCNALLLNHQKHPRPRDNARDSFQVPQLVSVVLVAASLHLLTTLLTTQPSRRLVTSDRVVHGPIFFDLPLAFALAFCKARSQWRHCTSVVSRRL